jgi:tryptophanase
MFGGAGHQPPDMELVRLAIPRRVYTKSHIDYVIEACGEVFALRDTLVGLRMTNEPPFLRHFTAEFEELTEAGAARPTTRSLS